MSQLASVSPEFSRCSVCNEPCQPWAERCWNDGDRLVHERCKNWNGAPFPFGWELDRLRRVSRTLRRAQRAVDAAGMWLATMERHWPEAAVARLASWAEMRDRLREELAKVATEVTRR
jgi:hypothetical protein